MRATKIRAFFGAVFALGMIFVVIVMMSVKFGWQIPILAKAAVVVRSIRSIRLVTTIRIVSAADVAIYVFAALRL